MAGCISWKMEEKMIELRGLTENNLKNISLSVPKGKLVVFTGVSGSGKSSVVFDTIAVEAARQLGETFPLYVRSRMPHYEAPKAEYIAGLTPAVVIDQKPVSANARSTVGTMTDIALLIRLLFSRCGEPSAGASTCYSFNDPLGMCPECSGLGEKTVLDLDKLLDKEKSLNEGAIRFKPLSKGNWQWNIYAKSGLFDLDKPLKNYSEKEWEDFLHGSGFGVIVSGPDTVYANTPVKYEGIADRFNRLYLNRDVTKLSKGNQQSVMAVVSQRPCPVCHGHRLNAAALETRIDGYGIADYCSMEIDDLIPVVESVTHPLAASMIPMLLSGLRTISRLGLGYLHLNRSSSTLSGGEAQRLKMVRHLGSSLTNMTYILDEPSVGLHPHDVRRLREILLKLRDKGNSVLVVEHDRDVIEIADEIIEMGPGPGTNGGTVLFQGTVSDLLCTETPTAIQLRRKLTLKETCRTPSGWYSVKDACLHNLKHLSVQFPAGVLCAVTGVAGSGKSTLIKETFMEQYPQVVYVDQSGVGSNIRSTPATYVGVMDDIRKLFAAQNGVKPGMFSANSEGACPVCKGTGEILPDMAFADPIAIRCEACDGKRYSQEALEYRINGKNILDVMSMTVNEAVLFFEKEKFVRKLKTLQETGLGYLTLGQPTSTLSGGECQRMKLASELHKAGSIYILDEPTTGLHMADTEKLMELMEQMVDRGNSVIVIEHNLDVIAGSDWVLDLGPGAGKNGGELVFAGTPRELLACEQSVTARELNRALAGK